ncbi:MAG: glycoside hydrolase family 3 protein [Clostridia bacterium]|nr:glycoside hydrolase family 3 protein [Clostridia bacterium]
MIDLKAKPFYLNDAQIAWVRDTLAGMTREEKIGQLFVLMTYMPGVDENRIKAEISASHPGGLRWQRKDSREAWQQNRLYQQHSRIPMLIAGNCDTGGAECVPDGTYVATAAQACAGGDPETAYHIGLTSAREAGSIGVNWLFNPVCDLYMNWRNTIVNTRSYGADPDKVLVMTRAYIKGVKDSGFTIACNAKHFPGDGTEERDQHLVMGCNDLSAAEWRKTFGKVYQGLIDDGIETVMVGHIAQRALSKELNPDLTDADILPATLSPELLQGVLRKELGFNGLIITDASQMIGFAAVMPRKDALPAAINAGCDMLLFANDPQEDFGYIRDALEKGVISQERLEEALTRILALKAHLGLRKESYAFPAEELREKWVGNAEHIAFRREAAEKCLTLVKDTQHLLPIDPKGKRAWLVYVHAIPNSKAYQGDPTMDVVREELEQAGFQVDVCPTFYDLEAKNGVDFRNFIAIMEKGSREELKKKYDVIFLVLNYYGYAQTNEVRVTWSYDHSIDQPWYLSEVPTVAVSLNYTNHLIDVPQARTFINAYGSKRENIHALVERVTGKAPFTGTAEETVFCGRWETRL